MAGASVAGGVLRRVERSAFDLCSRGAALSLCMHAPNRWHSTATNESSVCYRPGSGRGHLAPLFAASAFCRFAASAATARGSALWLPSAFLGRATPLGTSTTVSVIVIQKHSVREAHRQRQTAAGLTADLSSDLRRATTQRLSRVDRLKGSVGQPVDHRTAHPRLAL